MDKSKNPSIQCSVTSCAYHCKAQEYCTLPEIKVGCCENNVGNCQETKCNSFKLGDHGTCCTG
ncbi:MAG: DUF1540 domain-containing protein [Oscillospiraceae bacterium]|nr:DUF1540 domain-containing protein [Oscillospiraceae bacterium]